MGKLQKFLKGPGLSMSLVLLLCFSLLSFAKISYADSDKNKNRDDDRGQDENTSSRFCDSDSRWNGWWRDSDFCKDRRGNKNKPPVVYIFATKYEIRAGKSTELYLKTKNQIDSCTASDGWSGTKSPDVRESVSPTTDTKYTITCSNQYGSYTDSVEISVKKGRGEPPTPTSTPPTLEFNGSPLSIISGNSSNLTWSSTNASFCLATNGWSGSKSLSGNQNVSPTATTTYTLACGGTNGTTTKNVVINVAASTTPAAPTVDLNASPLTIYNGTSSTLSWSSTNATSCTASNGWSGAKAITGTQVISPSATTTYSLSCTGAGGTANDSVTVGVWATSTPPTPSGHVLISEVYYDVASTTGEDDPGNEWVELYNGTGAAVDIGGWWLRDSGSSGADQIPAGTIIPNGSFLLLTGSSTTANFWPGKTFVLLPSTTIGNGLANSGDGVVLQNAASSTIDQMSYGSNTSVFTLPLPSGSTDGHSFKRASVSADNDTAADWVDEDSPTPGSL